MANVVQADLSGGYYTGAMTTVYGAANTTFAATGWFSLNIGTPFLWDGTSNLCIEVCYNYTGVGLISTYGGCQYTAVGGNNHMGFAGGASASCATAYPGTGSQTNRLCNVRLTVTAATPCSGAPAVATASSSTVCSGSSSVVSLSGLAGAAGYTYLWKQSSTSSYPGSFSNASGTNNGATYTTPASLPFNPTYYVCEVTCTNSGLMTPSIAGNISLNSFLNCYCTGTYAASNGGTRGIVSVGIAAPASPIILNTSAVLNGGAGATSYTLYTGASPVSNAGLIINTAYVLAVKVSTQATASNNAGAWIDYNQNGFFETAEFLGSFANSAANSTTNISFTVPGTALIGNTAMRVRHRYGGAVTSTDACTNFTGTAGAGGAGETEDYRVSIAGGCVQPTLQVSAVTVPVINTTTATLNWIPGNGNKTLIILRQGSAVSGAPVLTTTYTDNLNFNFGSPTGSSLGSGNVMFGDACVDNASAATITGLFPGSVYHYAVYSYFSASHCYNLSSPAIGSFTTASCSPTIQPTIPTILCVTNTTMNLSFVRGNGSRVIVLARAGSAVNADPVYNTSYSANAVFGSGSQIGTGNYVVYDGNASGTVTVPLTGLVAGTTYYFQIYEYNISPNCYNIIAPATISSATLGGFYLSSTTTQNTANTSAGALAQDIVKLTIVTGGNLTQAVFLNSITFTTTGSTNVATDVTNAKIFFTGNSNAFSNATQFGSTFTTNPASLIATGNFALLTGNNYFWIAYDVKSTAVGGHVLDATITSFNISENGVSSDKTPSVIAPAGNRPLPGGTCAITTPVAAACAFTGCITACCQGMTILNATFGNTLANFPCNAANNGNGYNDLTATYVFTVNEGSTYSLSFNFDDWIGLDFRWAVWIDWNGNGDFRDSGERYPSGTITNALGAAQSITVPTNVATSGIKMRLWIQSDLYPNDCPYRTTCGIFSTSLGYIADVSVSVPNATGVIVGGSGPVSCATLAPTVSTPITYALNAAPSQLTATGTNLLWYTSATGGVGSSTAPIPSTIVPGTTAYYVSQTNSSGLPVCEGPRTQIAVIVNIAPPPSAPVATATQPTCSTILTGSILLSSLPSIGSWTINPNSISGSGTTNLISSVAIGGPYSYTVTNSAGCISAPSNSVTIIAGPVVLAGHWVGGISTDWNNPANWCDGVPTYTTDVTIPSSALTLFDPLIDLGGIAKCKSLTIKNGAILSISSNILDMKGDLIVEPSGIYDHSGGLLELSGTSIQTIPSVTCYDLKINNSAGIIITGGVTVTNYLNLFSGIVSTGGSILNVINPDPAAVFGFNNTNYINGRLIRYINNTGAFDFPIGDATRYELATVTVNNLIPTIYLLGEYFPDNSFCSPVPNSGGGPFLNGSPITELLDAGYWTITPDDQPVSGTYNIQLNERGYTNPPLAANYCAVIKRDDCFSLWQSLGVHTNATQNISGGTVTAVRTNLTSFSDFGIGFGGSSLPIQLTGFTADYIDNNINAILKWTTASELNCNHFDLEVSNELGADGKLIFRKIGEVAGCGTSFVVRDYSFVDRELNKNGIRYYRLKEVDDNGDAFYSQIVSLVFGSEAVVLSSLYPNPTNKHINYELISSGVNDVKISITNLLGQEMMHDQMKLKDGINKLRVDVESLPEGIYFINIFLQGKLEAHYKFEKYSR